MRNEAATRARLHQLVAGLCDSLQAHGSQPAPPDDDDTQDRDVPLAVRGLGGVKGTYITTLAAYHDEIARLRRTPARLPIGLPRPSTWRAARSSIGCRATADGGRRTKSASTANASGSSGDPPLGDDADPSSAPRRNEGDDYRGTWTSRPRSTGGELVHVSALLFGGAR